MIEEIHLSLHHAIVDVILLCWLEDRLVIRYDAIVDPIVAVIGFLSANGRLRCSGGSSDPLASGSRFPSSSQHPRYGRSFRLDRDTAANTCDKNRCYSRLCNMVQPVGSTI